MKSYNDLFVLTKREKSTINVNEALTFSQKIDAQIENRNEIFKETNVVSSVWFGLSSLVLTISAFFTNASILVLVGVLSFLISNLMIQSLYFLIPHNWFERVIKARLLLLAVIGLGTVLLNSSIIIAIDFGLICSICLVDWLYIRAINHIDFE